MHAKIIECKNPCARFESFDTELRDAHRNWIATFRDANDCEAVACALNSMQKINAHTCESIAQQAT